MIRTNDAETLCRRGNTWLAQQRYEEALISYDKALAISPKYVEALHCRGIALRNLNRPAEALASHDRALRIRPKDAQGLLIRAIALRDLGRPAEALASYDKALAIHPNYVEALHNRGTVFRDLKRPAEALASHDRGLAIRPDDPVGLYNRGNILFELMRYEEALAAYDKALALKPGFAEALNNRGNALAALKRYTEAITSYDKAIAIRPFYVETLHSRGIALRNLNRPAEALASHDRALAIHPDDAEGLYNRGVALFVLMHYEEALAAYEKALALKPDFAEAFTNRGTVLRMLRRLTEAIDSYRQARVAGGDSEQIEYMLAGLGAASSPITAPKKFIIDLFDQYAANFEEHLACRLKYRAPAQIFEGIARFVSTTDLDVLDLGCGTGLVGIQFRPLARSLTGVDLSPNMLAQARTRQIYDQLVCADVTEFLQQQESHFDLVVAGDLFIYIGDLSKVFQGVRSALREGGLFGFSIETSDGEDFVLGTTLRYAHSVGYLQRLATDNHFALKNVESAVIRQEEGVNVPGCVIVMRSLA